MKSIRYLILFAVTILCLGFIAQHAQAAGGGGGSGVWLNPAIGMNSNDQKEVLGSSGNTQKASSTTIGFTGGYKFDFGLIVGAGFVSQSNTFETVSSGTTTTIPSSVSGFGPAVGYVHNSGFFLAATLLMGPTMTTKYSGVDVKLSGGSGMNVNVGYHAMISNNFGIGPQLGYLSHSYKKYEIAGVEADLSNEYKVTDMSFMLGMALKF